MNAIVRKHYPVERLPEELRVGFPVGATVEVSVVEDTAPPKRLRLSELVGKGPNVHGNEQEVLAHLGSGRDDR